MGRARGAPSAAGADARTAAVVPAAVVPSKAAVVAAAIIPGAGGCCGPVLARAAARLGAVGRATDARVGPACCQRV